MHACACTWNPQNGSMTAENQSSSLPHSQRGRKGRDVEQRSRGPTAAMAEVCSRGHLLAAPAARGTCIPHRQATASGRGLSAAPTPLLSLLPPTTLAGTRPSSYAVRGTAGVRERGGQGGRGLRERPALAGTVASARCRCSPAEHFAPGPLTCVPRPGSPWPRTNRQPPLDV